MATHFVETPSLFFAHYTNRDYNWKIRNDGRKTKKKKKKKSRSSNDGDFGLRGRRYWRDENDGDSVPMTESWQVCSVQVVIIRTRTCYQADITNNI